MMVPLPSIATTPFILQEERQRGIHTSSPLNPNAIAMNVTSENVGSKRLLHAIIARNPDMSNLSVIDSMVFLPTLSSLRIRNKTQGQMCNRLMFSTKVFFFNSAKPQVS